LTVIQTELKTR